MPRVCFSFHLSCYPRQVLLIFSNPYNKVFANGSYQGPLFALSNFFKRLCPILSVCLAFSLAHTWAFDVRSVEFGLLSVSMMVWIFLLSIAGFRWVMDLDTCDRVSKFAYMLFSAMTKAGVGTAKLIARKWRHSGKDNAVDFGTDAARGWW